MIIIQCLKSSPYHISLLSVSIINLFVSKWLLLLLLMFGIWCLLLLLFWILCVGIELCLTYEGSLYKKNREKNFEKKKSRHSLEASFSHFSVCLLNKSSTFILHSSYTYSHTKNFLLGFLISTICSILVKLNWSQSIGTEIRKGISMELWQHMIYFLIAHAKISTECHFPHDLCNVFPSSSLYAKFIFVLYVVRHCISFGSFLSPHSSYSSSSSSPMASDKISINLYGLCLYSL